MQQCSNAALTRKSRKEELWCSSAALRAKRLCFLLYLRGCAYHFVANKLKIDYIYD